MGMHSMGMRDVGICIMGMRVYCAGVDGIDMQGVGVHETWDF